MLVKNFVLIALLFLIVSPSFAQRRVKSEIHPGRQRMIYAGNDTLWVMTRRDVLKLISKADQSGHTTRVVTELRKITQNLERQVKIKEDVIQKQKVVTKTYESERNAANEEVNYLRHAIHKKNKEIKRHKTIRNISIIGGFTAVIIGIII